MIDKATLKRYINNQYSDNDLLLVKQYLESEDLSLLNEVMNEDWDRSEMNAKELHFIHSKEMLANINAKIKSPKLIPTKKIFCLRSAAAVLVLVISTLGVMDFMGRKNTVNENITYQTTFGEIKHITLPDSSIVTLNANSKLYYAKNTPREVWLEGEAFFKVKKKISTKAKFWVHTDDLEVEVLGTAFNVRNRGQSTEVYLEEGKVTLDLKDENSSEISMKPGEVIEYSVEKNKILDKKVKNVVKDDWKTGVKEFHEASLSVLLNEIELIHGLDFEVQDSSLLQNKYSLPIPVQDSELTLKMLERLIDINIQLKEGKHLVTPKNNM